MSTGTKESTSVPSLTVEDFDQLAERVDKAIAEVQALDPAVRAKAMAIKSAIEEFHKLGLTHIVRTLKNHPQGKELLYELVDEPSVYALFSMHGLVRADLKTRVSRVIDMVRPYMQSHGGDVHLVDVRDRTAYVTLAGSCNGCSMSSVTLRSTVEESLREHVPEIQAVEVVASEPETPVVQIAPKRDSAHGWIEGPSLSEFEGRSIGELELEGHKVLLVRSKLGLRAYRNACAHQGLPLDGGLIDEESGTLTCPWHGFQFDVDTGECFSAPQCQLEGFPMRIEAGKIWIRLST